MTQPEKMVWAAAFAACMNERMQGAGYTKAGDVRRALSVALDAVKSLRWARTDQVFYSTLEPDARGCLDEMIKEG